MSRTAFLNHSNLERSFMAFFYFIIGSVIRTAVITLKLGNKHVKTYCKHTSSLKGLNMSARPKNTLASSVSAETTKPTNGFSSTCITLPLRHSLFIVRSGEINTLSPTFILMSFPFLTKHYTKLSKIKVCRRRLFVLQKAASGTAKRNLSQRNRRLFATLTIRLCATALYVRAKNQGWQSS